MNDVSEAGYGRSFDGKPGDLLTRLHEMLATTPPAALATRPMRRLLLQATIAEIERLRSVVDELRQENAALRAMGGEEQG